ncbi:dimethylsulfonioproprionate lyase family protein [Ensifer sp. B1-9]|uniref:dimethylsulfonioproprionate lyase family protein n=1 Tax=Ensifer sp. B1-9 TaxID=3141455 RepID=UPI003D20B06B
MLSLADPVQATCTDHFFGPSISELHVEDGSRGKRTKALKQVIRAMEDSLLGQNLGVPGTLPACKMLNLLQSTGVRSVTGFSRSELPLRAEFRKALNTLADEGPNSRFLAAALSELEDGLVWYSAKSGPFASVNFERNHAHAILGAPSKMNEGEHVLLGITIMAPYTRFPDYVVRFPRVMFPLSPGEYKSISGEWKRNQISSPLICAAGREFAMRCTSQPLLSLWCQRLAS